MPSPDEIQRIATAMNALRPDWRYTSLVTFLTKHHAARPYRDLAIAAVAVATDPRTETPNLLNEHGPWWASAQTAAGVQATTYAGVPAPGTSRCTVEGHEHELASNCRTCRSLKKGAEPTTAPTLRVGWTPHDAAWAAHLRDPENNPAPTTTRDVASLAAGDYDRGDE